MGWFTDAYDSYHLWGKFWLSTQRKFHSLVSKGGCFLEIVDLIKYKV